MTDKVLTKEFVSLLDGYKITKVDDLIKKIKADLTTVISDKKEFEILYSNALDPVYLDEVVAQLAEKYDFDFFQSLFLNSVLFLC